MVDSSKIREAFADRLSVALDEKDGVRKGRGRNVDLRNGLKSVGVEATTQATSKWLRAESMPEKENMRPLASWLGVNAQWLEYGEGPKRGAASESNVEGEAAAVKDGIVPVVGMAQLGTNGYFEALDFPVGHGDGYIQIYSGDPNAYALKVVGDSMQPRIRSGEFVLIEPNRGFVSGDEVLVKTVDGRSMIKVFMYRRDGEYRLLSVNDAHPPTTLQEAEIEIIHPVGAILKGSRYIEL